MDNVQSKINKFVHCLLVNVVKEKYFPTFPHGWQFMADIADRFSSKWFPIMAEEMYHTCSPTCSSVGLWGLPQFATLQTIFEQDVHLVKATTPNNLFLGTTTLLSVFLLQSSSNI